MKCMSVLALAFVLLETMSCVRSQNEILSDEYAKEAKAWSRAQTKNSIAAYESFLEDFPKSDRAAQAYRALFLLDPSADTVMIDEDGASTMIGSITVYPFAASFGDRLDPEPGGPIIVYIFRTISPGYASKLAERGVSVRAGGAYLWIKGEPFSSLSYIRDVDLSMEDHAIAAEFGVDTERR